MPAEQSQSLVWLITGCSSGFGVGLVRTVLKAGHKVIASSRDPSKTPNLVREVEEAGSKWITLDVTASNVKDVIKEAVEIFGRIDVLVNNAGFALIGSVEDIAAEGTRNMFETNVFGPVELTRAVTPFMRKNKAGCIVNISSLGGYTNGPAAVVYCATKHALEAITEGTAAEIAPFGITSILVEPGLFRTNFLGANPIPPPSEPYRSGPVQDAVGFYEATNNKQPGDPLKACQRILELVTGTGLAEGKVPKWGEGGFVRVPLGADAAGALQKKAEDYTKTVETWTDFASSTLLDGEVAHTWK